MHIFKLKHHSNGQISFKYRFKTPKSIRYNPDRTQQNKLEWNSVLEALKDYDDYLINTIISKPYRDGRVMVIILDPK